MQFPTLPDFALALDFKNYEAVPDDWFIAIGDVIGSTSAIAGGRYKDVNLAGAATIAAIQNACIGIELPFAFGGDGGIVLLPPDLALKAREALRGVQQIGREVLNLNIRCGLVPIKVIRSAGRDVRVAFQDLGQGRRLAMIAGGGIDYAEMLCKESASAYAMAVDAGAEEADLSGLSCRWQPLQAQRGTILSLIVQARADAAGLPQIYRDLYASIADILGRDFSPVSLKNLRSTWPPRGAGIERRFGHSLFTVYGQSFLAKVSELTGLTIGGFDGRHYARAMSTHSDFRKFADSLRMVIDCSEEEVHAIHTLLLRAQGQGSIQFGLHQAPSALMTCFVSATHDGGHIHFIDGAEGGYALAAQGLKAKAS